MSNKTLILIICAIIVICAGGAGYFYWLQTRPLVVSDDQIKSAQEDSKKANQPNLNPPMASSTPKTPEPVTSASGECKRNFDQNKLNTAKVAISGRQVEMEVKGFGKIKLEFYDKDAPKTVENFLRLVNAGYYDCLTFHRIGKEFMIQGGDPTGSGSGGESAFGGKFADELNSNTTSYKTGYVKGVLAMANAGANTNGSQFFILVADYPLDHNYTIFGHVVGGQDVADKISIQATTNGGVRAPKTPLVMQSVKIIK